MLIGVFYIHVLLLLHYTKSFEVNACSGKRQSIFHKTRIDSFDHNMQLEILHVQYYFM